MKKEHVYHFHEQFVLRTPMLPVSFKALSNEELFNLSRQPFFMEAIYLASPVLHDELLKWHNGEITDTKEISRLSLSVYKYYRRMQSRCTPYGLFAGCGTGFWTEQTEVVLDKNFRRHTRLDMNYLCTLVFRLNRMEQVLPLLRFYPNNSRYISGGSLRYVEYHYINGKRVHEISSVENTPYLSKILDLANSGASLSDLADSLVDDEISKEEAMDFVRELVTSQLLVSELEPTTTGEEFIHHLLATLDTLDSEDEELQSVIRTLRATQQGLEAIDLCPANPVEKYRSVYKDLSDLKVPLLEGQLFQTDLYKNMDKATLNSELSVKMQEAITFLNKLLKKDEKGNLKRFCENFYNRYEEATMPLLEVLDTETGIGFSSTDAQGINELVDDLAGTGAQRGPIDIRWTPQMELLHNKLMAAIRNDEHTVIFTDEDLGSIDNSSVNFPDTMSVMFEMCGENKVYMHSFGGSGAACLLGRFGHGDPGIRKILSDIDVFESRLESGRVIAEIVHLPESRIGNILFRPDIRRYEIPYLAKSTLSPEYQLPLQDLMVSVRQNKVLLWSKRLNKEVVPRLSTAHNYVNNALPVYQFLCEMQHNYHDKLGVVFGWGPMASNYKFLPRAQYKDVIFETARWRLDKEDLTPVLNTSSPTYMDDVKLWRNKWKLPERVLLDDGENKLLIDFEDEMSLRVLESTVRKRHLVIFREFLFDPADAVVRDAEGNPYTNEFIAVLRKNEAVIVQQQIPKIPRTQSQTVQRNFAIGDEWLYYKVFCGVKTADKLLAETIKPVADELLQRKWIDKFFFIRYNDPDHHLRLRFHISRPEHLGDVVASVGAMLNPGISDGSIFRIQTDTYKRELERYGSSTITQAESLFFVDSVATLQMLEATSSDGDDLLRWQFAIRSIDQLMDVFGYTPERKLELLERLKNAFTAEHGSGKALKVRLDTKFRHMRKFVESSMAADFGVDNGLASLLEQKRKDLAPIAEELLSIYRSGASEVSPEEFMPSFIHMMLNRIFRAKQRTYEMVVYDLLYRYRRSSAARDKKNPEREKQSESTKPENDAVHIL